MKQIVDRTTNLLMKAMDRDAIRFEDVYLPPRAHRFCNEEYKNDAFYVTSAEREVERLQLSCGLAPGKSVLDIGSGQGRLAIGLQRLLPTIDYLGIDVHAPSVDWCRRHIERRSPRFRFALIDAANPRYNKRGKGIESSFRLPVDGSRYDLAFLYSVFTHMMSNDVAAYLREIQRALRAGAQMFATVYLEEDVPDCEANPPGYLTREHGPLQGPLHRVRFNRQFFEKMVTESGLRVLRVDHRCEPITGQSVLIAGKGDS